MMFWLWSCPKCRKGRIFRPGTLGGIALHRACPECHRPFGNESGYYLGTLVAAYFLGAAVTVPSLILLIFGLQWPIGSAVGFVLVELLVLLLPLLRVSRAAWIWVDWAFEKSLDDSDS